MLPSGMVLLNVKILEWSLVWFASIHARYIGYISMGKTLCAYGSSVSFLRHLLVDGKHFFLKAENSQTSPAREHYAGIHSSWIYERIYVARWMQRACFDNSGGRLHHLLFPEWDSAVSLKTEPGHGTPSSGVLAEYYWWETIGWRWRNCVLN